MRCGRCKEEKPESEFAPSFVARGRGYCRSCHREYGRQRLMIPENREAQRQAVERDNRRRASTEDGRAYNRAATRKKLYGMTADQFEAMVAEQGGQCAICGTDEPVWHVDHDHSCCPGRVTCGGKCVRGLCHQCNTGLGMFRDNPAILESALGYLEKRGSRARASGSFTAQ